jgi:hypothetical protein
LPLTVFTPAVVTPEPLAVRLLADEFRYGVKSLVQMEFAVGLTKTIFISIIIPQDGYYE